MYFEQFIVQMFRNTAVVQPLGEIIKIIRKNILFYSIIGVYSDWFCK